VVKPLINIGNARISAEAVKKVYEIIRGLGKQTSSRRTEKI